VRTSPLRFRTKVLVNHTMVYDQAYRQMDTADAQLSAFYSPSQSDNTIEMTKMVV
jgi:hypothetical protein